VSALLLASPNDDLGPPAVYPQLPEPHREFITGITEDPDAAMQELSGYTATMLFDMVMADYPASDEPVYGGPGFRTMLRSALADGFAHGSAGYARDTVLATAPWPSHLMRPGVDVGVLFGSEDRVHSPDLGATLTSRIPGATRAVLPDVGGSLLWARPEVVLDAARSMAR
jgi:pimeloyl-ACP methyl ester carboxylesterase